MARLEASTCRLAPGTERLELGMLRPPARPPAPLSLRPATSGPASARPTPRGGDAPHPGVLREPLPRVSAGTAAPATMGPQDAGDRRSRIERRRPMPALQAHEFRPPAMPPLPGLPSL